jgi:hypothetical protein
MSHSTSKIALVIGASGGIGGATAAARSRHGWTGSANRRGLDFGLPTKVSRLAVSRATLGFRMPVSWRGGGRLRQVALPTGQRRHHGSFDTHDEVLRESSRGGKSSKDPLARPYQARLWRVLRGIDGCSDHRQIAEPSALSNPIALKVGPHTT